MAEGVCRLHIPTLKARGLFSTLRLFAWLLLALGIYAITLRLINFDQQLGVKIMERANRLTNAINIDCEAVGIKHKFIPPAHQYHPVVAKDEHIQKECRSRYEQHCLWQASDYRPSSEFLRVLRAYEKYHLECVEGHDLRDLANRGSVPEGTSTCQYIVWTEMDGKGNQLISLVSAFMYALLTQRVLLISREAQLEFLLCEPFPFSSWLAPDGVPNSRHRPPEERHGLFYAEAMKNKSEGKPIQIPKHLVSSLSCYQEADDLRFFCEGEQKLVKNVPWLFFISNNYIVPGFYFVPSFRAKLNKWFPDRAVFLHAGRYLLSPRDDIWMRIMDKYKASMALADRRVGIQVRAWNSEYKPIITQHILSCAWYSGLLPRLMNSSSSSPTKNSSQPESEDFSADEAGGQRISVVLASLRREYSEGVAEVYAEGRTRGRELVTVFSPSAEGQQFWYKISHDREAISDMWLLSFADQMISTPKSTFGYVAHGLAGIKPFVFNRYGLDLDAVPDPPCLQSNVPGPCFIDHPHQMSCQLDDPSFDIGDSNTAQPEVRHCLLQWGVGIFEDFDEFSNITLRS